MQIAGLEVSEHKVGIILGDNNTGKTRLLKQIEREYKNSLYVDCLSLPDPVQIPEEGLKIAEEILGEKPKEEMGSGYRRTIAFAELYARTKPEILLLDNPETLILDIFRIKRFAEWLHKNVKKLTLIATQSSDVYVYVVEANPENTFFILTNGKKLELMSGEEAMDYIDFEDLRMTTRKL